MLKRARLQIAVGLASLVLVPGLVRAQAPRNLTVEYEGAPLSRIAESFANFSGRSIAVAPGVGDPTISGSVRDLDWKDGLDRLLASQALIARPTTGGGLRIERERPMSVEYQDAQLADVVRAIAAFSEHTIVITPGVGNPQVSASLTNVDWQRGLDQILTPAGLMAQADAAGVLRIQLRTTR
jgi:ferric-dicitrate binding protein FerR (iron transport regulator)